MMIAASILERAGETVGENLPRFAGALALLIVGLIAARLIGRLVRRLLIAAGLDKVAERGGLHDLLVRAGLERSASRVVAFVLRVGLSIVAVLAAVSVLDIRALNASLDEGILFLPRLIAALLIVFAGVALGTFARERVDRTAYQMDLRGPLGSVTQGAIVVIALVVALGQLGISTAILVVLAGIAAGGAVLTFTLAFGLGGRELARELSAGRYVSTAFEIGQLVTVAGERGEIVALESASAVLTQPGGETLRVPNHLFLETAVQVHPAE